jgi:hypothetical protein
MPEKARLEEKSCALRASRLKMKPEGASSVSPIKIAKARVPSICPRTFN